MFTIQAEKPLPAYPRPRIQEWHMTVSASFFQRDASVKYINTVPAFSRFVLSILAEAMPASALTRKISAFGRLPMNAVRWSSSWIPVSGKLIVILFWFHATVENWDM